jgi:hypothetical protein
MENVNGQNCLVVDFGTGSVEPSVSTFYLVNLLISLLGC